MLYDVYCYTCVVYMMKTMKNVILEFLRCLMREQMFFKTIKKNNSRFSCTTSRLRNTVTAIIQNVTWKY